MNGPITTEETYHISNILRHYDHAREKHPYFCDRILYDGWTRMDLALKLECDRKRLHNAVNTGTVSMPHVMSCEMSEALIELANNNTSAAVEELYDAVAVLLRTIDVIEGRQPLGKPKTIAEKYAEVRQRKESGKPQTISGNEAEK